MGGLRLCSRLLLMMTWAREHIFRAFCQPHACLSHRVQVVHRACVAFAPSNLLENALPPIKFPSFCHFCHFCQFATWQIFFIYLLEYQYLLLFHVFRNYRWQSGKMAKVAKHLAITKRQSKVATHTKLIWGSVIFSFYGVLARVLLITPHRPDGHEGSDAH